MGMGQVVVVGGGGGETPSGNYVPLSQKALPGGVATLNGSGKVPKTQISLIASDVGALPDTFTETDPTVSSFTKGLNSSSAVLSALNLAGGNLTASLFPFSISDYVPLSQKSVPNGVATLDSSGKIPKAQMAVLIASDVGAIASESDPTVPNFTKGLDSSNAVLSALNLANGTLTPTLIPFSINDYIPLSQKGTASGIATLDGAGKVPKSQINLSASDVGAIATETDPTVPALAKTLSTHDDVLSAVNAATGLISASRLPSYVDDVLSYSDLASFPATGETAKIYVAEDSGKIYRWSGSSYIEILSSAGNTDTATKLATPRTISATGDGSWSVSFDGSTNATSGLTLTTVNLNPGSFGSATQTPVFTVDAKGRITAISNMTIAPVWESVTGKPTTLSGFGITDAQPLGNELSALQALADGTGFLRKTGDGSYSIDTSAYLPLTGGTLTGGLTITGGSFTGSGSGLTALSASNLASGTIPTSVLPNELSALQSLSDTAGFLRKTGDGTYAIDANSYLPLTGGTLTGGLTITGGSFTGSGSGLTSLSAAQLTGTVPTTSLPNEISALQNLADTAGFLKKTGDGTYAIDTSSYLPLSGGTLTGAFLAASGTSLLPGISFDGDTDTGIYRSADNVFNFVTGGVTRVAISTTKFDIASSLKLEVDCTLEAASQSVSTGAFSCAGGGVFMKALWSNSFNCATDLLISGNTAATNTTTGSLKVPNGGASIGGNLYVGGIINGNGSGLTNLPDLSSTYLSLLNGGTVSGDLFINSKIGNTLAIGEATRSSSIGLNIQNTLQANGSRYSIQSILNIDNTTALSASRTSIGYTGRIDNLLSSANQGAFTHNIYGGYFLARNGVNLTDDAGASNIAGCQNLAENRAATGTTLSSLIGGYNRAFISGTLGATSVRGTYNLAQVTSAATATEGAGSYNLVQTTNASSVVTTAYGVFNNITNTAGSIPTAYGVYNIFAGTIGVKWGIYSSGDSKNYLTGNLGLGIDPSTYKLDVSGTTRISGQTIINDNTASTSTTTGAFIVDGGIGAKDIYAETAVFSVTPNTGGQVRLRATNYGVIHRNDNSNYYVLLTNQNDPDGVFNNLRPFNINLSTGELTIGNNFRVSTPFTPASATATGTVGRICWDTNYLYICIATNIWKRVALSAW